MALSQQVQSARQQRYERRRRAAARVIPVGPYCYKLVASEGPEDSTASFTFVKCPYWKHRKDKPQGQNGYCRLLKLGDFTPGKRSTSDLWDHVKACAINDPE